MKKFFLISKVICFCLILNAQEDSNVSDTLRRNALNIHMDATDYIKEQIPYINFVKDIIVANVYVITSMQNTGFRGIEELKPKE